MKRVNAGFTLVELSVILLALGLILPAAVLFWQQSEQHRVRATQTQIQQRAYDALLGFAQANYRLPCPALDALGVEDCSSARQTGFLPWRTLSLATSESGRLRYGVYRAATSGAISDAPLDQDLAVARDRMNPLRSRTSNPKAQNSNAAPNPNAPVISVPTAWLLGDTQSGIETAPLNASCDASKTPPDLPCPTGTGEAVNLLDLCLALNTGSEALEAPGGRLAVQAHGKRRAVAFVVAAPGLLDADATGQAFDGANATVSNTDPTFEAPGKAATSSYDDQVMAASHAELFTSLQCAGALAAVSHAHFNVATGARAMERAMYDYRDQLYIAIKLAEVDELAAGAGIASAAAGISDAAKEMVSAVADTTQTAGARSFQIGLAAVGIALSAASAAAAVASQVSAGIAKSEAQDVFGDFAAYTTAMTDLAIAISDNALRADAIGH